MVLLSICLLLYLIFISSEYEMLFLSLELAHRYFDYFGYNHLYTWILRARLRMVFEKNYCD